MEVDFFFTRHMLRSIECYRARLANWLSNKNARVWDYVGSDYCENFSRDGSRWIRRVEIYSRMCIRTVRKDGMIFFEFIKNALSRIPSKLLRYFRGFFDIFISTNIFSFSPVVLDREDIFNFHNIFMHMIFHLSLLFVGGDGFRTYHVR